MQSSARPAPGLTLPQIDEVLAGWRKRLAVVADNLLELQADCTYGMLTGSGGMTRVRLEGATRARVEPALGAMLHIFEHFSLLQATLDHAGKIRRSLPSLFGAESKLREIQQLLFGRSIQLPPREVPLDQRTLLSGIQGAETISPEELLGSMGKTFTAARDAVMAVSESWRDLGPEVERAEAQLRTLTAQATAAGPGCTAALADGARVLAGLRGRQQTDPLGTLEELHQQVWPVLRRVAEAVQALARVHQDLAAARARLAELRTLQTRIGTAAAEAEASVAGAGSLPAPLPLQQLQGLEQWLDRLAARCQSGATAEAVEVGLSRWHAAAEACLAESRRALAACQAPLATRNELRGRMDALKAKARTFGVAEAKGLVELSAAADGLLHTRPMDLPRTAEAIAAYEHMLSGGRPRR